MTGLVDAVGAQIDYNRTAGCEFSLQIIQRPVVETDRAGIAEFLGGQRQLFDAGAEAVKVIVLTQEFEDGGRAGRSAFERLERHSQCLGAAGDVRRVLVAQGQGDRREFRCEGD